uniref:DNA topoisomerase (ATP-hydrolyzing) n=1 Tax=Sinocyclocheilus grahami TaxID=75366 RepID=A0A672RIS6_SINGR
MSKTDVAIAFRFHESVGLVVRTADVPVTTLRCDCPLSAARFALILKLLSVIYKLVQSDSYATKRDIYYNDPQLFGSQKTLDSILDDISCMLKVPRRSLHVFATSKGLISGDLCYLEEDGTKVNCSSSSTGKGVPDVNSRLMVRKLWDTLHVPVFALVDADPYGIEIMCIYKYGSRAMAFEAHSLTVPSVLWLGLLPSDIQRYRVPEETLIPFSQADESKLNSLKSRDYISCQPAWEREIETMQRLKQKAEIQSLASIAPHFLTRVYLPNKLRYGGWI